MLETALSLACIILASATAVLWRRLKRLRQEVSEGIPQEPTEASKPSGLPSSEMLSGLLDTLGEACIIIDSHQKIVFTNEAVSTLFGGLILRPGSPLSSVIRDHKILDLVGKTTASGIAAEREFTLINGTTQFLQCSMAPIILSSEIAAQGCFSLVVRDMTAERETEQIRKDFVANASHELRTPLSIINGYLENLLDGVLEPGEETARALETMARHGERITRIVEDMLTISRFESSDSESLRALRSKSFDLADCAADVISRLAPVIEENKTIIQIDIPPEAAALHGDRGYWDQVIFNLVDNAIKENISRSIKVTISASNLADGSSQIFIFDDGVGIPSAHIPFVFKRFYRVAKHHSGSKIKGTGLGLSIVKRAVEAHGGTIVLTSTPGIETKFTILVPPLEEVA